MCARLLEAEKDEKHGRFFHTGRSGCSRRCSRATRAGLKWVLRHQFFTLMVAVGDARRHGLALRHHPERAAAAAGHRTDPRRHGCRAIDLVPGDGRATARGRRDRAARSGRRERRLVRRRGHGECDGEHGPSLHHAEAARRARRQRDARSSSGCARRRATSRASRSSCRRCRTCRSIAASSRTQYQYTLQDAGRGRARGVGAGAARENCATLPELADVASDQQIASGLQLSVEHRSRAGRAATTSRRRRSTTRSTTRLGSARSRSSSRSSTSTA